MLQVLYLYEKNTFIQSAYIAALATGINFCEMGLAWCQPIFPVNFSSVKQKH